MTLTWFFGSRCVELDPTRAAWWPSVRQFRESVTVNYSHNYCMHLPSIKSEHYIVCMWMSIVKVQIQQHLYCSEYLGLASSAVFSPCLKLSLAKRQWVLGCCSHNREGPIAKRTFVSTIVHCASDASNSTIQIYYYYYYYYYYYLQSNNICCSQYKAVSHARTSSHTWFVTVTAYISLMVCCRETKCVVQQFTQPHHWKLTNSPQTKCGRCRVQT